MSIAEYRDLYGKHEVVQMGFNPKTSTLYKTSDQILSNRVKGGYSKIYNKLDNVSTYDLSKTIELLKHNDLYTRYIGKSKYRTMINDDSKLYKSVIHHTSNLDKHFKRVSFTNRIEYLISDLDDSYIMCSCKQEHTFNKYCNKCPDRPGSRTAQGKTVSDETRKRIRISTLNYISKMKSKRIMPRYNVNSISIIEEYGITNGYSFIHAENVGEYHIKELGYFLDAYDPIKNVVLEIDESHHYDKDGQLIEKDVRRQKEIEDYLQCKFIRIRI
jgi:hypothetical protein